MVLATTNFNDWVVLTNFRAPGGPVQFADVQAGSFKQRFYRLWLDW